VQPLLKHLQYNRVETIMNRAMLPRFEQCRMFSGHDQPQPIAGGVCGIAPRW